jgi:ubiquinone biosynthesis protein COQ4
MDIGLATTTATEATATETPFMLGENAPQPISEGYLIGRQDVAARNAIQMVDPGRKNTRLKWVKGAYYLYRLGRNKEKTSEVFHVFEALPWRGMVGEAAAYLQTARGRHVYETEPFLPDILDDHAGLRRRFPAGSLAHVYCDYMESEGLSAEGLVAEFEDWRGGRPRFNDQIEWYVDRLRDTHDLLHMLTDIGRDTLGEQVLGAYVFHQRRSVGHIFMGYVGPLVIKLHGKARAPLMRAARECHQAGKACARIAEESILELLAMPIDAVRQRLGVVPVTHYHEVHRVWKKAGIDPYKVLTNDWQVTPTAQPA